MLSSEHPSERKGPGVGAGVSGLLLCCLFFLSLHKMDGQVDVSPENKMKGEF